MPRSLGGAIAAIVIGLLLALYVAGLASGVLATLLLIAGWIIFVLGVGGLIYILVNRSRL